MNTTPQTTPKMDATLAKLADDIIAIMKPDADARTKLDEAKGEISTSSEMSIRALAKRMHGINRKLSPDDIEEVATRISEAYPKSKAKTKSDMKTFLGQRQHLPHIVKELDTVWARIEAANDNALKFNLREKAKAAAIRLRNDPDLTVVEAIRALDLEKAPMTQEDKDRVTLDRLRKSPAFQDTIGDEKLLKPGAQKAFDMLEAVLSGEEPEEDTRVAELEEELANLRARLAEAVFPSPDFTGEDDLDVFADLEPDDNPVEAVTGTLHGDEKSVVLDTFEEPTATPALSGAVPEPSSAIKKAAIGKNFAGYDNLDDLLDSLQTKPKG